jgi:hypothetical protein
LDLQEKEKFRDYEKKKSYTDTAIKYNVDGAGVLVAAKWDGNAGSQLFITTKRVRLRLANRSMSEEAHPILEQARNRCPKPDIRENVFTLKWSDGIHHGNGKRRNIRKACYLIPHMLTAQHTSLRPDLSCILSHH